MADLPVPSTNEVIEAIKEVNQPAGFPGEFKLGDGTVVKAASWEEAFQKVADMKVHTAEALRDREAQIETLRQSQAPPPVPVPEPGSGFDQKKYWELMNADPLAAQQYMDGVRFGVDPNIVPNLYREVFNASQYSADTFEITQFLQNNPDFPGTTEATDIVVDTCAEEGRPLTKENLEYVYLRSVRDGKIEPAGEEAEQPWAPPSLKGGGGTQSQQDIDQLIANTPDNKLDEVYKRLGLLK
jgi:hypothetical protein